MSRHLLALSVLLPVIALAADEEAADKGWKSTGDARWIGSTLSHVVVDADGTCVGQGQWLDQRLRIGFQEDADLWSWEVEWDMATGQLAGHKWDIDGTVDARRRWEHSALMQPAVVPRKFSAQTVLGNTQVVFGLTTSHWGLGMVANDGAHDPMFGRADFGDRVVRLRATSMPGYKDTPSRDTVLLTAAADWVVADDIAEISQGQQAIQGVLSAMWLGADQRQIGVYSVFRQQWEVQEKRDTQAFVLDLFADVPVDLGDGGWTLRMRGEGAGIVGTTDRSTSYASPGRLALAQLGGAAHLTVSDPGEALLLHLRAGYASGDGDPDDKASHDFTFDRDFAAGFVLFDQLMGGVEAATHAQLSDPENSGQAPDGAEALVTEGSFRRATFLQPIVQLLPVAGLDLRAGATLAFATAPVSQPYYTYRAGGTPHNHHDVPSEGRFLGTELDWAAGYTLQTEWLATPSLEVQGGHLLLGKALQGAGPNTIHHVAGAARFRW